MKKIIIGMLVLTSLVFAHQVREVSKMKNPQVKPENIAKYDPKFFSLKESSYSFEATLQRAKQLIENQKIKLFAILDHSKAASEFGKSLPPTVVIVFGNPAIGTDKMNEHPNIAIELPMKVLIYERNGKVFVGYLKPDFYAKGLGLSNDDAFIKDTAQSYKNFTNYLVH